MISYSVNLGGLTFDQASTSYQLVDGIQPAERSRRRVAVTAPHVAGDFELSSVADASKLRMTIRCYGGASNAQTLVDAVVAAVEQQSWTLTITWDGATRSWPANAADWTCPIEGQNALARRRDITIVVPVQPYPS